MAVAENAGAKIESSNQNLDNTVVSSDSNVPNDLENPKPKSHTSIKSTKDSSLQAQNNDQNSHGNSHHQESTASVTASNGSTLKTQMENGHATANQSANGVKGVENGDDESFKDDMSDSVEILSKLNPMAQEFVPPSLANNHRYLGGTGFGYSNHIVVQTNSGGNNGHPNRRRNYNSQGRHRMNARTSSAQREDVIRRTIYVSDIDQLVTEEHLASLFLNCGPIVDCRICGDPNSVLRFAFIEFTDEVTEGARAALTLSGTMLGYYPVRVLPSKTAIAPVNPTFLPRSEDEREMCSRTVYCASIDKKVTQADVKLFFESLCGEVHRLRLLGDYNHSTRIAFVEFAVAESAIAALNCSGAIMGSFPIRVIPSKTPVRARAPPRIPMH
ncbi:polyadenylate-binding protein-interacting protein 12-like isoform X1 [Tripterygium wilfordii]|uniref:polyadenylate-binding protein-interacting protein 12-like isoform X1 n=1 Tax=Tripterygium wilfordii TaxID=458696 RepID=UPI0018F82C7E|nr:polyadenylate-binding protein-interacting protein 12-like isoform X1 [Tripterygium wilfordii]XP_038709094.1 polyadenylate-binding protein-interacting protein 12-like isoform X1 [Tripterygium wilfordii]